MKQINLRTFLKYQAAKAGIGMSAIFSRYQKGAFTNPIKKINGRVVLVEVEDSLAEQLSPKKAKPDSVSKRDANLTAVIRCDCGEHSVIGDKYNRCRRCIQIEGRWAGRKAYDAAYDAQAKYWNWMGC